MSVTTFADGLREIAERYQGFIIDQWGVLHDGGEPYPGALDCLRSLRAMGVRIVLLSNSGKRAAFNQKRLAAMGYDDSLYDAVVTSGEACWQAMRDKTEPGFVDLGRKCYLWGRGGDLSHVDGLDMHVVDDAADADFLFLAGVPDYAEIDAYLPVLEMSAKRGLPLICANPDIVAIYPNGGRGMAPGGVAKRYEEIGGQAIYVGKPHRPVYELCLKKLDGLATDVILGIGDSMQHDIAGGNGIGIDTTLLTHGVLRDTFADVADESSRQAVIDRLESKFQARPRWVLPSFIW